MNNTWRLQRCWTVVWNAPASFAGWVQHVVQCRKICAKTDEQWSKMKTAMLSALTSRSRPKTTPPSSPTSSLVMNLWVFGYDPETKQQLSQWKAWTSPRPKKAQQVRNNVKPMLLCFFDNEGIVHKESVPPGHMVNGKFYCDVLRQIRENIQHKCPDKWRNNSWALHHDNIPAHTLLVVQQFLASMNTSHPPPYLLTGPRPWFFPVPEDEIQSQGAMFWQQWRDPEWITGCNEDADMKKLSAVLPIMDILLGLLYQCRRGLLQSGWRRTEIRYKWLSRGIRILGSFG